MPTPPGQPTITVSADMVLSMDKSYLANQGETITAFVDIDSSLWTDGLYACIDISLPDGTTVTKGSYDYSTGEFVLSLGLPDITLACDGFIYLQCSLVQRGSPMLIIKRTSNKFRTQIKKSIMANTGNANPISPVPPVDPSYIYASTSNMFLDATVYKLDDTTLAVVSSTTSATPVYDMIGDGSNLYGRGTDGNWLAKYTLAPAYVDQIAYGGTLNEWFVAEQGDYIYVTTSGGNTFRKHYKSDLTLHTAIAVDSLSRYIGTDDTYLYSAHGNKKVYKSNLSDLTKVTESAAMEYYPQSLTVGTDCVFVQSSDGESAFTLYKFNTADMSTATSISTGLTYYRWMTCDSTYLYAVGEDSRIYKHNISDLALVDTLSGTIDHGLTGIIEKDGFLYCGGATTVRKYNALTLDYVTESADFTDWVYAVAK